MYTVEIKHPNTAIGAKNKKAEFTHLDDAHAQFMRWKYWLDAKSYHTNKHIEMAEDADGYVLTLVETHTIDEIDYDTHN